MNVFIESVTQGNRSLFILLRFILSSALFVLGVRFTQAQNPCDSLAKYKTIPIWEVALEWARKCTDAEKARSGDSSLAYARSISDLGLCQVYTDAGAEAEPFLNRALSIQKRNQATPPEDLIATYYALTRYWQSMDQFEKAIEATMLQKELVVKVYGEMSQKAEKIESQLAIGHLNLGNYPASEQHFLKSLEIHQKLGGEENAALADQYRLMGILYKDMGDFVKADRYFNLAFPICEKVYGPDHPRTGEAYNNLGAALSLLGNYEKSLAYYLKGLDIRKKTTGEGSYEVGQSYMNLANAYKNLNKTAESLRYHDLAIRVMTSHQNRNPVFLAYEYINAGSAHLIEGNLARTLEYELKAESLLRQHLSTNHPDYAIALTNLADLYHALGRVKEAIDYNNRALAIWQKTNGPYFHGRMIALQNMTWMYADMGEWARATKSIRTSGDILVHRFKESLPSLSDEEKHALYESNALILEGYKSFGVAAVARQPTLAGDLYNFQLATKGMLVNSSAKWKHRIKSSGDVKLFGLYTRWLEKEKEIIRLRQSGDSAERAGLDSILRQSNKLERELSLRSENFAKLADRKAVNWQEVHKRLKPGEAAVEIVRCQRYGRQNPKPDTTDPARKYHRLPGFVDTTVYMALMLKPEWPQPKAVLLTNGNDLEEKHLKYYQNAVSHQLGDKQSYTQFWQRIADKLGPASRVFFSPDGVYHQINLNTLQNPKTGKFLLEEKDIRLVTSTKDLVNPSPAEEENKLANLVGFPSYYAGEPTASIATTERKSPQLTYGLQLKSVGTLAELPGTKVEVDKIANVLTAKGWEVKNYTDALALEENIKESYKPRLLHIATHGFFQPDSTPGSNPLLRSGLMLTGAGTTLKGQKPEKGEDGILTAYEAMNLNLDNTDLVVLSACETGLGEIRNGEGVYGLQRAFRVAGAKSIIMSLWKVDDAATQELMVAFYNHWLENKLPQSSKRAAFLKAQKELKAKYPNPYYWGAFVMVGE